MDIREGRSAHPITYQPYMVAAGFGNPDVFPALRADGRANPISPEFDPFFVPNASFVAGPCGIKATHKPHHGEDKGTPWSCDGTMITRHPAFADDVLGATPEEPAQEDHNYLIALGHLNNVEGIRNVFAVATFVGVCYSKSAEQVIWDASLLLVIA
jgi:hypothetical protein